MYHRALLQSPVGVRFGESSHYLEGSKKSMFVGNASLYAKVRSTKYFSKSTIEKAFFYRTLKHTGHSADRSSTKEEPEVIVAQPFAPETLS